MTRNEYFESKCSHVNDNGTDAFICVGTYGDGYEQCIICGKVICTEPDYEDSNRDLAALPY